MCIKGKAAPELVYNSDRLNHTLKRTRPKGDADPGWQRVGWDEALDDIARRIIEIRDRYGAKSIALAKGTKSGTSVDDVERWLGRLLSLIGSPNWSPRQCTPTSSACGSRENHSSQLVTPAEPGVHRKPSRLPAMHEFDCRGWIPAFAGMTRVRWSRPAVTGTILPQPE